MNLKKSMFHEENLIFTGTMALIGISMCLLTVVFVIVGVILVAYQ